MTQYPIELNGVEMTWDDLTVSQKHCFDRVSINHSLFDSPLEIRRQTRKIESLVENGYTLAESMPVSSLYVKLKENA